MDWHRSWLFEGVARAGYTARGLLYLMVGVLSLMAAFELRGATLGVQGALTALGRWPAGPVWLFALGSGLVAHMAWRFAQAVLDTEGKGTSLAGLARRFGQVVSGLGYGALGCSALDFSDDLGALLPGEPGYEAIGRILGTAFESELLFGAGMLICVVAVGYAVGALRPGPEWKLGCEGRVRRWAVLIGRVGYLARSSVLLLLGSLTIHAAFAPDAVRTVSLGRVLQSLEAEPSSFLALAAAALGLGAYGAFGLVEARYRCIPTPSLLRLSEEAPP